MATIEKTQHEVCARHGSAFCPTDDGQIVGVALHTLSLQPVYGVRENAEQGESGWYIWAGEYSDEPGFFKPVHAKHLRELFPIVLPFLALEHGFKFIADDNSYVDVWREP